MTEPPVNSEEDSYMEESFDEEVPSDVEEEQEYEEDIDNESDTHSDTDVEAEYMRGNPHARRQQLYSKRSGGGSGFARQTHVKYDSSSSEDDEPVVVTQTVAEVNTSTLNPEQTDDESISVRTLIPKSAKQHEGDEGDSDELTEVEDEMEDELAAEDEIDSENEFDGKELATEIDNDGKDEEATSLLGDEQDADEEEAEEEEDGNEQDNQDLRLNMDLVDIADGSDGSDSEMDSSRNSDPDLDGITNYKKLKRGPHYHPNLPRKPIVDTDAPVFPKLESIYDDNGEEVYKLEDDVPVPGEPLNVKYLEQQMTEMSEMIMKTFRLSGGSADNSALEQLALATKLMKKHGKPKSLPEDEEPQSLDSSKSTPTTMRTEQQIGRRSCRCPSSTDVNQPGGGNKLLMDECGQGDGLLRYPHMKQTQSARMLSSTPSCLRSETSSFHVDVRRPRSVASSEVNYKNLGRKSFSFTNPQVREIERQNNILLKKMMNVKPTIKPTVNMVKSNTNLQAKNQGPPVARRTTAAVNRKKYQRQIDLDNDVLKRKLEAVGSRRPIFKNV
ncbi:protein hemingway isoform X1 [Drosophila navojoa]|uniref:protein hemingway isoform X1 n=2 Tax=Drosophila navojoa TaxID=7232 RepID=UPI000847ABF8|nr:protein hemingway isoform X1 [Drosophila navojoa]